MLVLTNGVSKYKRVYIKRGLYELLKKLASERGSVSDFIKELIDTYTRW